MNFILKVLVGSRAHGLHTEQSDFDYRGVFVQPTAEILKIGGHVQQTSWVEGREAKEAGNKIDDTAWEIGHFLGLAMHCNPSILEVFTAPVQDIAAVPDWPEPPGKLLRDLFPAVWHPKRVRDAFIGYGLNQRKKFLEDKDARPHKYAVAYLRVLLQAERLLTHGVLSANMQYHEEYQTLIAFKTGLVSRGQVIDKCLQWQARVEAAADHCQHEPDPDKVNDFLLDVRRRYW